MDTAVVDVPEHHRFELRVDGRRAGLIAYSRTGDVVDLRHTETDEDLQGQGLASVLVREALDDLRRRQLGVVPTCPYVRRFIDRHPEYADLVRRPRQDREP